MSVRWMESRVREEWKKQRLKAYKIIEDIIKNVEYNIFFSLMPAEIKCKWEYEMSVQQ